MASRYLFSVEAKHELVKLPHFGPFLTATEAGQADGIRLAAKTFGRTKR